VRVFTFQDLVELERNKSDEISALDQKLLRFSEDHPNGPDSWDALKELTADHSTEKLTLLTDCQCEKSVGEVLNKAFEGIKKRHQDNLAEALRNAIPPTKEEMEEIYALIDVKETRHECFSDLREPNPTLVCYCDEHSHQS